MKQANNKSTNTLGTNKLVTNTLVIKNLNKIYDNGFVAVKNFNYESQENEFIVLVGPSGCGKTTTLRMIAGLEDAESGEAFYNNRNLLELPPAKRSIGMVFQNYALYPHLTVFDNIAFPLKIRKDKKEIISQKVNEVAGWLELTEILDRKPKQLSGGQRQRVALGRAVVRNPDIFLFDEPLSNLDAKLRITMRAEIKRLHKKNNGTSIYVTHDQIEAMTMADKIIVMNKGEISQVGTPEQIYNEPDNQFVAEFIGSTPINLFSGNLEKINDKLTFKGQDNISFEINYNQEKLSELINIVIALRPERLSLEANNENDISLDAKVISSENLGYEYLITLKANDKTIKLIGKSKAESKNTKVFFDINSAFIFDADGKRLA